jgi:hypothetical protein
MRLLRNVEDIQKNSIELRHLPAQLAAEKVEHSTENAFSFLFIYLFFFVQGGHIKQSFEPLASPEIDEGGKSKKKKKKKKKTDEAS